jgi:hypothetical protein
LFDALVVAAFGVALVCLHASAPAVRSGPIDAVNPLLGDASFVATFGRPPGPADDDELRIRTHLQYVERRLRAVDVSGWDDTARRRRLENLDRLRAYIAAGVFPAGESREGWLPTFIDDRGRRCAVADLVESSAGSALAIAIAARFRNAYIAAIDDPAFDDWIAISGLSRAELAMIQPSYRWAHERIASSLEWRLGAQTLYALSDGTSTNPARTIAAAEGGLRWVRFPNSFLTGKWMLAADGAAGAAFSGDAYYRLVFRGGMVFSPFPDARSALGVDVGAGGERLGAAVPGAGIVPFEVYWNTDLGTREAGFRAARLQVRGEGQLVLAGRSYDFVWGAYVEALWLFQREFPHLRGLALTVGMRELGGVRYGLLALGFNARELSTRMVPYRTEEPLPWGWGSLP